MYILKEELETVVQPCGPGCWDFLSQHAFVLMMPRQLIDMFSQVLVVNKAEGDRETSFQPKKSTSSIEKIKDSVKRQRGIK